MVNHDIYHDKYVMNLWYFETGNRDKYHGIHHDKKLSYHDIHHGEYLYNHDKYNGIHHGKNDRTMVFMVKMIVPWYSS